MEVEMVKKCILILSVSLFFCSYGFMSSPDQDPFRIIKEEGVPVAVNPDHPVPTKNSPRDIAFAEELTIGEIKGDPHYVFSDYISYAVDEKGNMYVLDWREKSVRKFDKNGIYKITIGGEGQGPGEFIAPKEIRFLPSGYIIVFEDETQKFSCFTLDGDFVSSGRFKKLLSAPYFGFSNGNIIGKHVLRDSRKSVAITGLYNANTELLFTFHEQELEPYKQWPSRDSVDARIKRLAEVWSKIAFRPVTVVALDRNENIYFAFTDRFEIEIYSEEAELKRKIRTELPFLPAEKKDRNSFLDYYLPRDISTWNTMSKQMQNKIKSLIQFPNKKPAFVDILPMDNDFVMVVRDGKYGQDSLIDIFDSSGRFIIEKNLNFHVKEGLCRRDKLYTQYEDEEGNKFVKRYKYTFKT